VPRQLPAAPRHFIGRQGELDQLATLAQGSDAPAGTVVISAIDGMAGIGKTALATHAAHRLVEAHPDGQLFLDLHGHTQGHPPRTAGQALTWLLQALGVPARQIPADEEQAAALYRQHLAGTRTLILLDNAASEAQVRPLLPGTGTCLVLITSRRRLKGLDDAHTLPLDVLPEAEAIALLRAVAGPDRIPADDPLSGEIAGLCGYLPLALRIAAALLRHRSAWSLQHLAAQLRDQHHRISALSDGERELAGVFDLSYTHLDVQQRTLFRRLGLIPGPDADAYAAAALMEVGPASATGLLENLVDHNLLSEHAPGRFRLHDLMRIHARSLAGTDPAADREAALDRLLHFYAYPAQSVSLLIARHPRQPLDGAVPAHVPAMPDPEAARKWLRTERPNLEAAFTHARTRGLDLRAIALAAGLAEIMQADGPWTHALEFHQAAAQAADRLGDLPAHATALNDSGHVLQSIGDLAGSTKAHTRAREISRALRDRLGEANAANQLGSVQYQLGDDHGAAVEHLRALEMYRALGNRLGEANALNHLGCVHESLGAYAEAVEAHTRALEIFRALGNRLGEANTVFDLARAREATGDYAGAADAHTRALETYRALGSRLGEANALACLGVVWCKTGDFGKAADAHTRALETFCALGNRLGEANTLNNIALVWLKTGDHQKAEDALAQALEIFRALGDRLSEATVLSDLGRVWEATGDYARATEAHTRSLEIFRDLGNRSYEATVLNHYAAALAATGQRARALESYLEALAINRELNKPEHEAISLEGIAEHYIATGDIAEGTANLRHALEIYRRLGMNAETEHARSRLASLPPRQQGTDHDPL
jgi:tetratricopeptide (TPR) repeat protein